MTNAERLLELGLKCPCGGDTIATSAPEIWITCGECMADGPMRDTEIDALTAWLILTGGPIPGEVKPPNTAEVSEAFKWRKDDDRPWWFYPVDRIESIIRPWLEDKYDE